MKKAQINWLLNKCNLQPALVTMANNERNYCAKVWMKVQDVQAWTIHLRIQMLENLWKTEILKTDYDNITHEI